MAIKAIPGNSRRLIHQAGVGKYILCPVMHSFSERPNDTITADNVEDSSMQKCKATGCICFVSLTFYGLHVQLHVVI